MNGKGCVRGRGLPFHVHELVAEEPCETCITSQIFLGRATLATKPSIEELAATFIFSHHPTSTTKLCLHMSNLLEVFASEPLLSCHGRCPGLSVGEGEKRKCDQDFRQ